MAGLVPRDDDDAGRDYVDLAAIFASAIPVLGGAVSDVLGGWSQNRRFHRIREVLEQLEANLSTVRDAIREEHIRSDEFEDLLDQALRLVAAERHEAKRRLYAAFLVDAVTNPGEQQYYEQLHLLRSPTSRYVRKPMVKRIDDLSRTQRRNTPSAGHCNWNFEHGLHDTDMAPADRQEAARRLGASEPMELGR